MYNIFRKKTCVNLSNYGATLNDSVATWVADSPSDTDIYCFCFQEAIELSPQNVFLKTSGDEDVDAGLDFHCRTALGEEFVKLRGAGMVGIYLVVFIRTAYMSDVSQVRVRRFSLGTFGGNKGGTAVELVDQIDRPVYRQCPFGIRQGATRGAVISAEYDYEKCPAVRRYGDRRRL